MRAISKKKLKEFWQKHPQSKVPLNDWFKIISKNDYQNLVELKSVFPNADRVGNLVVFNISGNKFRLITAIHYNTGIIFVRQVLTHAEYNKEKWKK
ncbi:MAG: type II toxin-antitoxin system HigB family toxin [SAR324 cluster bacterium]|nr:type II toxin-antitoxin system HigB family toxin [SAR324 cluster bacterium]